MAEPVVIPPRATGLAVAVVAFPALSVLCVLFGVVAMLGLSPIVGAGIFFVSLLLSPVPVLVLIGTVRKWSTLELDDDGLTLVAPFGTGRFRLTWYDQRAVGVTTWRGNAMIAVRPYDPPDPSQRFGLTWLDDVQLLLIAGLDNWMLPRDAVVSAVQQYSDLRWTGALDSHPVRPADRGL